ncbi:hypothetical protein [Burkholderia multivorans]|uniref:hypothetical protein n=1 Tax=Burkholderia multivorans TaxID=87883 RepID=UPI0002781B4B|nr:hypothetical protein [Burkholderia multivorans]EJO57289.1 hypothetical protein BURMUCF2_A1493 [Burkholderia multivorans CF2]MBU9472080.1 hypothetical protein [Burkholderia multivorans]
MDKNNNYEPSFAPNVKKQTIKMLEKALGFVMGCTHPTKSRELADKFLQIGLGRLDQKSGVWLRRTLLNKTDYFFKFQTEEEKTNGKRGYGKANEYTRNEAGCEYVRQLLIKHSPEFAAKHQNVTVQQSHLDLARQFVSNQFGEQLQTGTFTYTEGGNSDRKWHTLQGLKSDVRTVVLGDYGYSYDYDIKSCYTTLITQYARQQGFIGKTPSLDEYSQNAASFRIALASECGLRHDEAKMVITALFNGASLQINADNAIFRQLGGSRAKMQALQNSDRLKKLRTDIKKIWNHLKDEFEVGTTKSGRKQRVSAKAKARLYFQLERMVLNAFTEELDRYGVKHLDIHDGCMVSEKIDTEAIQKAIKQKTGFEIELVLKSQQTSETKNDNQDSTKAIRTATAQRQSNGSRTRSKSGKESSAEGKIGRISPEGGSGQTQASGEVSTEYSACVRERVRQCLAKFRGNAKAN